MTKTSIKTEAAAFIKAAKLADWNQEAHVAFVAKLVKQLVFGSCNGACSEDEAKAIAQDCASAIMTAGQEHGSTFSNASAFRQWLQSKDVALLPKQTEAEQLSNRFAGLV